MTIKIDNRMIPGTQMDKEAMGNVTGLAFLDKIFYIQQGIMLAQIRDISGIDGSTLQNWVKRGWTGNAINKKYSKDQLSRILLINMMRQALQLEKIDYLLHYINGDIDSKDDDIIPESKLYDYVCRIVDAVSGDVVYNTEDLRACIAQMTSDHPEVYPGARDRLNAVLEIIVTAYNASLLADYANAQLQQLSI
ncbi:MAG: DUF1836 domain-containing protein [Ruminococcaceae bacterium]|nr:DUF1836 domain-containing protein [Oscillospiraceae bacterium]